MKTKLRSRSTKKIVCIETKCINKRDASKNIYIFLLNCLDDKSTDKSQKSLTKWCECVRERERDENVIKLKR